MFGWFGKIKFKFFLKKFFLALNFSEAVFYDAFQSSNVHRLRKYINKMYFVFICMMKKELKIDLYLIYNINIIIL